jgi:hypothetical protein
MRNLYLAQRKYLSIRIFTMTDITNKDFFPTHIISPNLKSSIIRPWLTNPFNHMIMKISLILNVGLRFYTMTT